MKTNHPSLQTSKLPMGRPACASTPPICSKSAESAVSPAQPALAERVPEILVAVMCALFAIIALAGCAAYTVLPADREVVPVRDMGTIPKKTYVENEGPDATGWYVPDSVMLELLDAE